MIASFVISVALAAGLPGKPQNDDAEILLQQALNKELVEGQLEEAIRIYRKVATRYTGNRAAAARAWAEMGRCYEKLGKPEARQAYRRAASDFADQREPARLASLRLAALEAAAASGIVARWIADEMAGALTRDGKTVCFYEWATGRWGIRELATGQRRFLTEDLSYFGCAGSPDGKHFVYDTWTDNRLELRLVASDGSQPRVLFQTDSGEVHIFDWSPDGRHLLIGLSHSDDRGFGILLIRVTDGAVRVLKKLAKGFYPIQQMFFSPDGRYIAYAMRLPGDPHSDIFSLAVDGGEEKAIVQHPAHDYLLGWAPDGKRILFASDRTGTTDAWLLPVAGGKALGAPQLIRKDLGKIHPLGFSPGGAFYYTLFLGAGDVYTASLDAATGKLASAPAAVPQRTVGSNSAPDWSQDGRRLVYISRRGPMGPGFNTLTVRAMDTGQERELTPKLNFLNFPRWFPDGRSVAVFGVDTRERTGLYRVDAETGEVTLLMEDRPGESRMLPLPCPDGKSMLYSHGDRKTPGRAIRMRNLETGEDREIVRPAVRFGLSRDGRQLAFVTRDTKAKEFVIKVMPLAGGAAREVYRAPQPLTWAGVSWTADGKHLILEPDHLLVPVEGGPPLKLHFGMKNVQSIRPHPDGRRIAFFSDNHKTELWVMENFLPPLEPR